MIIGRLLPCCLAAILLVGRVAAQPTEAQSVEGNDIIVTAAGRAQIAQDVPIALSVVSGRAILNAGISDVRGLRGLVPSLQATTGQSAATGTILRLRGVGTAGDNPGFEPAVGIFIDGVLRARAGAALADLPPVERVEVLRGPQGTLFGRNSPAGVLNVVTEAPRFDAGGYIGVGYGNYNETEIKAGVTGPVSPAVALRVDGGYHRRNGYITDVNSGRRIDDLDRASVRGQALLRGEAVSVRLIGDYARTDEQCCGALNATPGVTGPAVELLAGLAGNDGIVQPVDLKARRQAVSPGRNYAEHVREWGLSAQLDADLGSELNLTAITAYRDWRALRSQDIDFAGLDRAYRDGYRNRLRDFTQEVRLRGRALGGRLDWLVGGFYLSETNDLRDTVRLGTQADQYVDALLGAATAGLSPLAPSGFSLYGSLPGRPFLGNAFLADPAVQAAIGANPALLSQFTTFLPSSVGAGQRNDDWRVRTTALAIFTHNIIAITDRVALTLGLRYNHETKTIGARLSAVNAPCSAIEPGGASSAFGQALAAQAALNGIRLLVCNPTINPEFNGAYSGRRSENRLTGTARLAFRLSPRLLLYGGYDRGYKSGGFNLDRGGFDSSYFGGNGAQIGDLAFAPETVDSYEAGIKTELSRAFSFNATVFRADFRHFQDLTFIGTAFRVTSVARLRTQGAELDAAIRPAPALSADFGYAYTDARYRDPGLLAIPALAGAQNAQLTNTPRHVVTIALGWTPRLSNAARLLVHADSRFNSRANTINDAAAIPFTYDRAYAIVNARLGVELMDRRLAVEAYVENLFDAYYSITGGAVPEQSGSYAVYPAPPRFYGVKARLAF